MFQVAIDGPSGVGKSTIARMLASALGIFYVDTGAMYRAIGVKTQRMGIEIDDQDALMDMLENTELSFSYHKGAQHIMLDGIDVEEAIRTPEATRMSAIISAIAMVRTKLVHMQKEMAMGHSIVMDGRDIGTHVLPNATYKFFLTASIDVRARRRYDELVAKGQMPVFDEIREAMIERDAQDENRIVAPLRPAMDAVMINTDQMDIAQVIQFIRQVMEGVS